MTLNRMQIASSLFLYFLFAFFIVVTAFGQPAVVYNYQVINQSVNDTIYSPKRRLLYASVPSTGGTFGNFIIAINPFTKQIVSSVFVGSEPNKIAISGDEEFLYVGLDGSASIRKVLLSTMTADISFGLGTGSFGLHYPEDIAVLPNQPNSVAVSRRNNCCSPRHEGVAIFDNGVIRTTVTPGHTGSNVIEAGDNENVLYGYNNETTDFGFRRMTLNSSGVSILTNLQNAIQGFNIDIVFSNGRIYSTNGTIVNPASNSLEGTFALQGSSNGVSPDPKAKRVFFVQGSVLKVFNSLNFQPTGNVSLANSGHTSARLQRWGRRGLSYRTNDGKLVFFETSLVPAQPNVSDFNGDELSDLAVFRPSTGTWFATSGVYGYQFGRSQDIPIANDYDGDNKTDLAVYRDGLWYTIRSSTQTFSAVQFGISSDKPVSGDFDGDQKGDYCVYRDGIWYVLRSSDQNVSGIQYGLSTDTPVPSDFDGDGKTDFAVFRATEGNWHILSSSNLSSSTFAYGTLSAKPAPADYDGDGLSDIAVWQNVFGTPVFYVLQSRNRQSVEYQLTAATSGKPVPMDFDGDGRFDPTVFNPNGKWAIRKSTTGLEYLETFGTSEDQTVK